MKEKTEPLKPFRKATSENLPQIKSWLKDQQHPFLINLSLWDYFTDTYFHESEMISAINRYLRT